MTFKVVSFFKKLFSNDQEDRIIELEKQVQKLEEHINQLQHNQDPPVIVEQLYVEKVAVEKVELTNNIGTLDIKELGGMLNIGANYGGSLPPQEKKKQNQNPPFPASKVSKKESPPKNPPKYNISFKNK